MFGNLVESVCSAKRLTISLGQYGGGFVSDNNSENLSKAICPGGNIGTELLSENNNGSMKLSL